MKNQKEQIFSFEETAKELGVPVEAIIQVALKEGLINIDGSPTQKAIDGGLLTEVEKKSPGTNTTFLN